MSSIHEAVLAQYEKNTKQSQPSNKVGQEEREKKYFLTLLPNGVKTGTRRIRILPTLDGSSPFKEAYFHVLKVGTKWMKIYDPKQEGKRSPLNEVYEALMATGDPKDKEMARDYRAQKFYIVKVIDRDREQDGPKFWRFKHSVKGDGPMDKIFPIFHNKGDITDVKTGRDLVLTLTLTKSGKGQDYTNVSSVFPDDSTPLHTDSAKSNEWLNDPFVWSDVYSKKGEDYLDLVAKGETPRWDSTTNKWASNSSSEETLVAPKTQVADPQVSAESDDDLPF